MEKTLFNIQYVILGNVMRELYEVRADNYDWGKNCIMAHQNSFNLICKLLQAIFLAHVLCFQKVMWTKLVISKGSGDMSSAFLV